MQRTCRMKVKFKQIVIFQIDHLMKLELSLTNDKSGSNAILSTNIPTILRI